jgi:hypothetical protein
MAPDNQGQFRGMAKSILADYYVVLSRSLPRLQRASACARSSV